MVSLRPYQIRTIEQVRAARRQGSRAVCVVMPTGAGKTRTMGEIARSAVSKSRRVLWLAHRAELVDQAAAALSALGLQVGCVSASATAAPQPFAPVQVATIQTLLARKLFPVADVIVADEAHHYVADTFGAFVRCYPEATILGPTATPERSDGIGLGSMFTRIVVGVRVRELVDGGWLVPAELVAPARKLRAGEVAQRPVDAYRQHAAGKRAICFSPLVSIAQEHCQQFLDAGIEARIVTGETPWAERREAFADLRAGTIKVLCNVYVATEGFDVPEIECVILARGFGADGTYIQCVGRALRPAPGKDRAIVLDLTGTSHVHGHPEDDRLYSLEGRGMRLGDDEEVNQSYCRVCGAPIVPGEPCPECGTGPREVEQRVTGEALVKYARKREETVDQRIQTLKRWREAGREKGYKPGWALAKYRAVYGAWPPAAVQEAAT